MSESTQPDRLEPALQKIHDELAKHLDEACDSQPDDLQSGTVDQLLHLEEQLLAAARAADEAVRLKRRLDERASAGASLDSGSQRAERPPGAAGDVAGRVREFRDRQGQAWRVWEVRPGVSRPVTDLQRYLGDYVNGWLAFGSLDTDVRKRLPAFPPDWFEMSDGELEALLHRAIHVPKRKAAEGA